ncbi:hypothetical protein [Paenibacillus favisporus]|uniref:hypothetical protein n=1 Tax=Paenibacillus favisporus TaxID=221028 RepID=UPI003D29EB84
MNDLNVSSYGYITPADKALVVSFLSTLKSEISYPEGVTCTMTVIVEQMVRDYIYYYELIDISIKWLDNSSHAKYLRRELNVARTTDPGNIPKLP